ncbi:MAG: prolipoprotein diacylglyceryl transferase [Rhodothermales bacterium]|nr:prolipoprotein diacylglyceryl transferase [Rhodothermales bacterium]
MYPRLSDIFRDLFGFELPFPIFSFGAMVAIGAMTAGWLLGKELDRYYGMGRIGGVLMKVDGKGKKGRTGMQKVAPSNVVWVVTMIALGAGFAGAKLFHILENLDQFARGPLAMIFSSGGFTFYGGLVVATIVIVWYLRKKGLSVPIFADSLAPGLMIAYGIGRLGCHLAGDGDWGIASDIASKPFWLPMWMWAETYPNNILGANLSQAPVYPTPIYEFLACTLLAGLLWSVRKHPFQAGWLFSLYLSLNGIERYLIEQIRVNNTFDLFGIVFTQAEMIAVVLFGLGVFGLIRFSRRPPTHGDERDNENGPDRAKAGKRSPDQSAAVH